MRTSYYQSKRIDPAKQAVVQTSVGHPRWGTQPEIECALLAPPEEILGLGESDYTRAYVEHLEKIGVDAIRAELAECVRLAGDREPLLCCFEALKKPGQFCHRRIFAWWWHKKTGEIITEL